MDIKKSKKVKKKSKKSQKVIKHKWEQVVGATNRSDKFAHNILYANFRIWVNCLDYVNYGVNRLLKSWTRPSDNCER